MSHMYAKGVGGGVGGMGWGGGGSNPVKILTIDGHISGGGGGAGFPGLVGIKEEQAYTQQLFLPHTLHIFFIIQ